MNAATQPATLASLLKNFNRDALQQIAHAHGLPTSASLSRKTALIKSLIERLSNADIVKDALNALPAASQVIFTRMQERGGRANSQTLSAELERQGIVNKTAQSRPSLRGRVAAMLEQLSDSELHAAKAIEGIEIVLEGSPAALRQAQGGPLRPAQDGTLPTFEAALWPLMERGLVFALDNPIGLFKVEHLMRVMHQLVVPVEVLKAASRTLSPLRAIAPDAIARSVEGAAQNFQRDVYLSWNYLREQEVTLTADARVPKRHLNKLNELMVAPFPEGEGRLLFIQLMMEEAGLIKRNDSRLEALATAYDFFGYSLARRAGRFFETWKKSSLWNELLYLPIQPQTATDERSPKAAQLVARARQYVLTIIAATAPDPVGGWLSIGDLIDTVRHDNYEFLFKRTREDFGPINPYYYYHNPLGWGFPISDETSGWDKVEAELIRHMVCQPLHWLGMVSLGYSEGGAGACFRLTPLGAHLLGINPQAPAEESVAANGRLVIQPNFQVFALEPISEQTLAHLDRFADRIKADRVFEYRLTRESLYRAQQKGMTVDEIIAFLKQAATAPLPQNVERTLEEWGASFERIIIRRNVSLLHARDAQLLDSLLADAPLSAMLVKCPLPLVAIARDDAATQARLLRALMARGQLPAFTHRPEADQHALTLADDGRVQLLHAVPDIYLLQALEQHSERRADGFFLTEAVVKAERAGGQSTEQIITRWERWHRGPLSPVILGQLRRWGQFYGEARVRSVTVIELSSHEVVELLLVDPEIGPLLSRQAGDPNTLMVADKHAGRVRALLEARGVVVS
ncbi:MAG: helicase-associated domain-containing protein [Chloroflexi bacterium]|nr:helicase-associated domain-containing protein [Chloroflexota bacterium]